MGKVFGRDYEATVQHCRYIAGPGGQSDFVADVITPRNATGDRTAKILAAASDLLFACKSFINADRSEHLVTRLNDAEYAAVVAMRVAIEKSTT